MRYLLIALLLASIAGLEFFHALSDDQALDANVCLAQEGKAKAVRDFLLVHSRSH